MLAPADNTQNINLHQNVSAHEMSAPIKCRRPWNVGAHEMSAPMKCWRPWNVGAHEMLAPMKCWRPNSYYLGSAESPLCLLLSPAEDLSLLHEVLSPPEELSLRWCCHAGLKWDLLSDLPSLYGRGVCRTVPACLYRHDLSKCPRPSNVRGRRHFTFFLGIFADLKGPIARLLELWSKSCKGEICSFWSPLSNEPPWDLVGVASEALRRKRAKRGQKSISAPKCPTTPLQVCTWSQKLSEFSCITF